MQPIQPIGGASIPSAVTGANNTVNLAQRIEGAAGSQATSGTDPAAPTLSYDELLQLLIDLRHNAKGDPELVSRKLREYTTQYVTEDGAKGVKSLADHIALYSRMKEDLPAEEYPELQDFLGTELTTLTGVGMYLQSFIDRIVNPTVENGGKAMDDWN